MAAKRTTRSKKQKAEAVSTAPTLVLLVRHGKTPTTGSVLPGRAAGLHLADEGVAQAESVAERIAELHRARAAKKNGKGFVAVYASPMERTRETAAPIAKALGLRVRQRPGLIECDFGQWTGRKLVDLSKLPEWKTVQRHPAGFRFPKGESFSEMQTRMVDTINALVTEHPGESIVAVSHADTIKAAVAQALGTPLDLFQRIVVGQCAVSAIMYGPTGPTVLAVNHTGDLVSLVPS
ncbi:MAG: histidine phosphatase family protein [Acidimicrobiales bacterium]